MHFVVIFHKWAFPGNFLNYSVRSTSAEGDTHQAKRTINAISKAYKPLGMSLYENKVVILCDKPTIEAQAGFDDFLIQHTTINGNGQIIVLDFGSLEECYPNFKDWLRTAEQVKAMVGAKKKKLAQRIGDEITQDQFEKEMILVFKSLQKTWDHAF